jgi:hypothetical protein
LEDSSFLQNRENTHGDPWRFAFIGPLSECIPFRRGHYSLCVKELKIVHLGTTPGKRIAKVAMARKLAVRLYWMWRDGWQYSQLVEFGSNARKLEIAHGVK